MTFRMAMSPTTGEEMVVMRRRIDARKMKTTPVLFRQAEVSCARATNVEGCANQWNARAMVLSEACDVMLMPCSKTAIQVDYGNGHWRLWWLVTWRMGEEGNADSCATN
jgi:hypothetical protein